MSETKVRDLTGKLAEACAERDRAVALKVGAEAQAAYFLQCVLERGDEIKALKTQVAVLIRERDEFKGEHEVEAPVEETGLETIARWVREQKAILAETQTGIFDSGMRCVTEGGEIFFVDPEEVEGAVAALARVRGPACSNAECPDYDGEHPYHQNAAVEAHEAAQVPLREENERLRAQISKMTELIGIEPA